jgi:predicted phage tail protein
MIGLGALVGIAVGAAMVLLGLAMIAPQVRVHQIRQNSTGTWIFRAGAAVTALGLVFAIMGSTPPELKKVGLLVAGAALLGGLFVWNHERAQAVHEGASRWDWPRSLTTQMLLSGVILLALALVPAA